MDPYHVSGIQSQDLQIEANTKRADGVSEKKGKLHKVDVIVLYKLSRMIEKFSTFSFSVLSLPCSVFEAMASNVIQEQKSNTLELAGEVNMKLLVLQELKSFEREHETYSDLCRKLLNFPCSPDEKKLQIQSLETRTSEAKAYVRGVVSELSNEERLVQLLEDMKNEKSRVQEDIFYAKKDLKAEEKQDKSKKKKK